MNEVNYEAIIQAYDTVSPNLLVATDESVATFKYHFLSELRYGQGLDIDRATSSDYYKALVRAVRRYLFRRWDATHDTMRPSHLGGDSAGNTRVVAYLSMEYLLGRQLRNAVLSSGLEQTVVRSLEELGLNYDELAEQETEPGLGNGGLGRLAACYIDSLATLSIPAYGYGIRYEYGIFRQVFENNQQVEYPDRWLEFGDPWSITRPEQFQIVGFGGSVEAYVDGDGRNRRRWIPNWQVRAVPNDWMVPGYATNNVNTLRLWSSHAIDSFLLHSFNAGDYQHAASEQVLAENITKVLYPEDSTVQGKELRLQQQYFFVAASVKDLLQNRFGRLRVTAENPTGIPFDADLSKIPELITFQLNDTHPVIAIPELLRILIDERGWEFGPAYDIVKRTFNYTCHTLLPEALEIWSSDIMERLLPRHMELINQINSNWLAETRAVAKQEHSVITQQQAEAMSIISAGPYSSAEGVRMAYLATVVCSKVNGVAKLHSQLLKDQTLKDFSAYFSEKFTNVTNGVTPRRFIQLADKELATLISNTIGHGWLNDLDCLKELETFVNESEILQRLNEVKQYNKKRLTELLLKRDNIVLNPDTMFDVMVKRLHEYKRQTLKILHVISLYSEVLSGKLSADQIYPRTVIFGAKAAPGYKMAKEIIHLINSVGEKLQQHSELRDRLTVAFPANYNVTLAENLIPAANVSEQISLAGKEASGTGNMKFMQTGAVTCGTLDGANVEIRNLVGDDNFYLFGMNEPEVEELVQTGYSPYSYYESNAKLKDAIDLISSGEFSNGDPTVFAGLVHDLLNNDRFMTLADFASYSQIQRQIELDYSDTTSWIKKSLLNIARSGYFSSDRAIQDYLDRIWHSTPVNVTIKPNWGNDM